jgi:hypothetical protein
MEQSKFIVESIDYQNLIKYIKEKTNIKILDEYRETAALRDNQKINLANLSTDVAINIIKNEFDKLFSFTILKLCKYENVKMEEEYPKGEEVEEEGNNETILGYSQGFLLMYLIEYYLLKENPSNLLTYLKAIRIPHASKYEKELKEIYSKL